jgi:hypothetical protein
VKSWLRKLSRLLSQPSLPLWVISGLPVIAAIYGRNAHRVPQGTYTSCEQVQQEPARELAAHSSPEKTNVGSRG